MKKNILLVQSLLVFPLMTSSLTLCMDKHVGTSLPAQAVPSGFKKNKKPRKRQAAPAVAPETNATTSQATLDSLATSATSDTEATPALTIEGSSTTSGSSIDTATAPETAPVIEDKANLSKSTIDTPATPIVETIIAAPIIEATQVEETVIVTPATETKPEATPAPAVKTSKYIINELTADEAAQAKEDLATANSLASNLHGLAQVLSVVTKVSLSELKHVELPKEKNHFAKSTIEVTPSVDKAIEILAPKAILMELTPDLEQSALASTEYTGFGFSSIFNVLKSYSQVVINLLEAEQFAPSNGTHKEYFNNALEECAKNKDAASLSKILKACQSKEQYQSLQSAVHHVAPAFNYLSLELQNQTVTSNHNLAIYNQQLAEQMNRESLQLKEDLAILLNQHKERVTALTAAFDARVKNAQDDESKLKNLITGIAALNAKVIPHKERLLETHNLTIPKNSVKAIEDATHQCVRGLLTHSNMPRASVLQIDNK